MLGAKNVIPCSIATCITFLIFIQRQELKSNFKYKALRRFYCPFIMYRTTSGLMPVNVSRDWCQQWPVLMGRPCQIMRAGSLGLLHLHQPTTLGPVSPPSYIYEMRTFYGWLNRLYELYTIQSLDLQPSLFQQSAYSACISNQTSALYFYTTYPILYLKLPGSVLFKGNINMQKSPLTWRLSISR